DWSSDVCSSDLFYGKLPMQNCILQMYFGQISQSSIYMKQLLNIKKENDDLGKQVNKLTNKLLLKTYLPFILTLLFFVNVQSLKAQLSNPQNGETYTIGGIDRKSVV